MLERIWRLSYDSPTIDVLRNSKYGIPLIQSVHLFGITLVLAAAVAFNLRLLGAMRPVPLPQIAAESWRWSKIGIVLAVCSGILVFIPDPARYAANTAFRGKMVLLILAVLLQFTWYRDAIRTPREEGASRGALRVTALASLGLWFAVGWAGRAIAFLG